MAVEAHTVPHNWKHKTLAEIVGDDGLLMDGDWIETKDQDPNGNVRLIQLADVGDGAYANKSARFMTLERAQKLRCTFLDRNDILVARMPDPLGRACLFPGDTKKAVTVVDICIVRPGDSVDRRWLLGAINESGFRRSVQSRATGTTRVRISRKHLSRINLAVPPIGEQRQIAEVLVSIDTAIERTRAAIDQVRVVKQALLADLMTNGLPGRHKKFKTVKHIGRLPESWDDEAVGALAADRKAICYGVVQPGGHVADGTPFIRVKDIEGGFVSTNDLKRIDPAISAQYTRSLLDGGELLVTLVGAIGRCAVTPVACRSFNIARAVGKVPLRSSVNARFVMHALNSTRNAALIGGSFESARMTLNLDQLVRVRVPIPEIDEQDHIVKIVDAVIAREQTEAEGLDQLLVLKAALSDALLTGDVRVPVGKEAVAG